MPQIVKSLVEVRRTARYYTLNSVQEKTKNVWIVLHGYGQLAEYFIKHFKNLDSEENFIIAPEGLSRFYVEGLTGRVGASWLTKEDREDEIKDQSNYINAVLKDCNIDLKNSSYRIIVLGFSQGTAAAVRWMVNNNIRPDQLILWAGMFPHDVNGSDYPQLFKNLPLHFVYGHEDQFLHHIKVEEKTAELQNIGFDVKIWEFNGKHVMDRPTLTKIVSSFED
ncbi:MAG: esterase [Flavobacteriales bacterium]|nr:esterase [Flavobacteriales bacterium]